MDLYERVFKIIEGAFDCDVERVGETVRVQPRAGQNKTSTQKKVIERLLAEGLNATTQGFNDVWVTKNPPKFIIEPIPARRVATVHGGVVSKPPEFISGATYNRTESGEEWEAAKEPHLAHWTRLLAGLPEGTAYAHERERTQACIDRLGEISFEEALRETDNDETGRIP